MSNFVVSWWWSGTDNCNRLSSQWITSDLGIRFNRDGCWNGLLVCSRQNGSNKIWNSFNKMFAGKPVNLLIPLCYWKRNIPRVRFLCFQVISKHVIDCVRLVGPRLPRGRILATYTISLLKNIEDTNILFSFLKTVKPKNYWDKFLWILLYGLLIQCAGDVIWRHRSGSTFPRVMACGPMAPSHYLNQDLLIITCVLWCSPESDFTKDVYELNRSHVLGDCTFITTTICRRGQWVKDYFSTVLSDCIAWNKRQAIIKATITLLRHILK